MDATHIHLLLNHFPIIGSIIGFCLLGYGIFRKNISVENAGLVVVFIISIISIPTYLSGEESEEAIEHLPGVSEYFIEQHEEIAEVALWVMAATGIFAFVALFLNVIKKKRSPFFSISTTILTLASLVIMTIVGLYGGQIRHSEIRSEKNIQLENEYESDEHEEEEDHER